MSVTELLALALSAVLAENFVLVKFLGVGQFLAGSRRADAAALMGLAVTFVMGTGTMLTWAVNAFLLTPLGLEYLRTAAYILVLTAMVQVVELFLRKVMPAVYAALGLYLPLVAVDCAVLGVALLSAGREMGFLASTVYGVLSGLGFTLAITLLGSVRERLEFAKPPKAFQGAPIVLVSAGLLAMAFLGFSGIKIW